MTTYKVNVNGQEATVEVTRQGNSLRVVKDDNGAELRLVSIEGPFIVLEQEQPDGTRRFIRVAGHANGEERQMWVDGRTFTYRRVRRRSQSAAGHDAGSLSASIPAVVSEVLVSVGDMVAAGDKLILLESMKMVIPIQAPHSGTVARINCEVGESVQAGVALIEIEGIGD